jgi:hypothetical protein
MVYWLNRQPDSDVGGAVRYLERFGKPVIPVGQAYDGGPEGGRPGGPTPDEITRFINAAARTKAQGVSFWSWQHASASTWQAIVATTAYDGHDPKHVGASAARLKALQSGLERLGYFVPERGRWDPVTVEALRGFQRGVDLPATGRLDDPTITALAERGVELPPR